MKSSLLTHLSLSTTVFSLIFLSTFSHVHASTPTTTTQGRSQVRTARGAEWLLPMLSTPVNKQGGPKSEETAIAFMKNMEKAKKNSKIHCFFKVQKVEGGQGPPHTTPASAPATTSSPNNTDFIRTSCNVTLYPDICYSSLSQYAKTIKNDSAQLARLAVSLSLSQARNMVSYVTNLSRGTNSGSRTIDPKTAGALHDCFSTFKDAVDQMKRSVKEMKHLTGGEELRFQMSNVQTWLSAALTNEETCTDGFQDVFDGPTKLDVCNKASVVKKFTSNGLALVNYFAAQALGGH